MGVRIAIGAALVLGLTVLGTSNPGGRTAASDAPVPAGPIKSVRVIDAKLAYDAEVRRAESDRADRVLAAKRAYKAALDAGKAQAMKQGDLDEANRIQAEIVVTDAEIKAGAARPAAKAGGLVITAARYGVPSGDMKDVTELVRSKVVGDALPPLKGLPDPAFGKMKTLVIEGTYGGREFVLNLPEAEFPASNFSFGAPPKAKP